MATRTKTIEFATTVDTTTLAGGANRDSSIAIYIPETISAFRSVTLMTYFRGDNTAAASLGAVNLYIDDASDFVGATNLSLGTPKANTGESETWSYAGDVTSYFTSNWSGTSNTWWVRYNGATCATTNHSFKLIITYDYDDTSATHIKTIRIPIESTRSTLTAAYQTIGGATAIPAVATSGAYLPEASTVLRQAFLELAGNEATPTSTVDHTTTIRINGASTITFWRSEQALSGQSCWMYGCADITGLVSASSAYSLEAVCSTATRVDNFGGWLTVTYEFSPSSSSTIYNSLLLGAIDTAGWSGGTTSADADSWGRDIFIEEPTTITLKESGVFICSNSNAGANLSLKVGAQGFQTYTLTPGQIQLGQYSLMHRIDSGGQNGVSFTTLARGKNSYEIQSYCSTNNAGIWGLNGLLILNYTSGKSTIGVGAHTSTKHYFINPCANDTYIQSTTSASCAIAETEYWVTGSVTNCWANVGNSTSLTTTVNAERQSGEGEGEGWEVIGLTTAISDNENQFSNGYYAARKSWKRYPADHDASRMDLEAARSWRTDYTSCQVPVSLNTDCIVRFSLNLTGEVFKEVCIRSWL